MDESIFERPEWYLATTLVERAALLRTDPDPSAADWDEAAARLELFDWRSRPPFGDDACFAKRLAADGVSEAELLRVLGEEPETVRRRARAAGEERPAWLAELREAYLACDGPAPLPTVPAGSEQARTIGFLRAVGPLAARGADRVRAGARDLAAEHDGAPFEPETATVLLAANLSWALHGMIGRALVLELNVARMTGELPGATAEERFGAFVERLRDPARGAAFLAEYPVLARQLVETVDRWARFALEFLGALARDRADLERAFPELRGAGRLADVEGGAGDVHRGGRSVLVVRFEGGARVVYKPRSLATDVRFAELLRWVNARGDHPPLAAPEVLDRGEYGWARFVAAAPCESREEAERFFRRQGAFLGLLHLLEATDFHFENLIAAGEHPYPVDLETLFHPRAVEPALDRPEDVERRLVRGATGRSVLRVGLLPQRVWGSEDRPGIDIGGLAAVEGQLAPDPVVDWEGVGTDEMRVVRQPMEMQGGKNLPTLGGERLDVLDFRDRIVQGLEETYRLCLAHRAELLSPDGPLERFAGCTLRSVLRPTRSYGLLRAELHHPDFLRDALELERFLDRLWVGLDALPELVPAVAHEREDLRAGDIPLFTSRPESRDVVSAAGGRLPDFWPVSGLEAARRRLRAMGEEDLGWQRWFARAALATLALKDESRMWPSYPPVGEVAAPAREAQRGEMLARASELGDELARLVLREDGELTWIGLDFNEEQWGMVPLLDDLYGGLIGVVLFLAHLGRVTGEERHAALAREALGCFRRRFARRREEAADSLSVGGFSGLGGVVYALACCRALWGEGELDGELDGEIGACLEHVPALLERDADLDVVGGAAGMAAVLLALHGARSEPRLLALARLCGERICDAGRELEAGIGWFTPLQPDRPITGFSHGAAGMTWALSRLAAATGEERFRDVARAGIAVEHTQFDEQAGNWFDAEDPHVRRGPGELTARSVAWCYGAPGIGLARLGALDALDEPLVREELSVALATTRRWGFGRNHCLCHGDLGNLDFLLSAARRLGDDALRAEVDEHAARVLFSLRRDGPQCGVPLAVESPGLMNGLAGIGYGLLRLAEPDRVPSVLALELPEA